MRLALPIQTTCLIATMAANASDYYVDNQIGSDALDGRSKVVNADAGPFRTIARAVAVVQPGDTIHLVPTGRVYRESIVFLNKGGEPGKTIADVRILAVPRSSTVALQGRLSDVAIQNLNVVYAANDGYNIHGAVKNARFVNCNAFCCFDDGFSSHDDCETVLDGAVYVHCDNGIANVSRCVSVTRNVVCDRARSMGILLTTRESPAPHTLENVILIDNPRQYSVTTASVDNLLVVRGRQAMGLGSEVMVKRATAIGSSGMMRLEKTSSVRLEDCLLAGPKGVVHVRAEHPLELLKLNHVVIAIGTRMEWGLRYPWQTQPMGEWLAQAGNAANNRREMDLTFQETLLAGKLPAHEATPTGCTPELCQRYLQYLRERDELLNAALRMAWGD